MILARTTIIISQNGTDRAPKAHDSGRVGWLCMGDEVFETMELYIFHSVDSALYIWNGTAGLLVDGIHKGRREGFSDMPLALEEQLDGRKGLFGHMNGAVFTHLHPDHFWAGGLERFLRGPDAPSVYGPGLVRSDAVALPLCSGMWQVEMPGACILAKNTVHDGPLYRDVPHQSYLLQMGEESVFVAGDAALSKDDAYAISPFCGEGVDVGFFNVYQLASPGGRAFLRILRPARIILIHLPFQRDDVGRYHQLARHVVRTAPPGLPRVEMLPHMSWLDGRMPDFASL